MHLGEDHYAGQTPCEKGPHELLRTQYEVQRRALEAEKVRGDDHSLGERQTKCLPHHRSQAEDTAKLVAW